MTKDNNDYLGSSFNHDSKFFTVTPTTIEVNLSALIRDTTFNSVKQKLGLILEMLRENLDPGYSYHIRLI